MTAQETELSINGKPLAQLSDIDRRAIEAASGADMATITRLVRKLGRSVRIQIEFVIFKNFKDGKLTRMPLALLSARDRPLATQESLKILQLRQIAAEMAAIKLIEAFKSPLTTSNFNDQNPVNVLTTDQ